MALSVPDYLDDQAYPAINDRYLIQQQGIVRSGVVNKGDLKVTQHAGTADMSVDVAAGAGFIIGTDSVRQGVYHVVNDGTLNVSGFPTADVSNPRIDSLYLQILDATLLGLTNDIAQFVIQPGTPTAGATLTNLSGKSGVVPPSSLLLTHVLIPTASGVITNANIGGYKDPLNSTAPAVAGAPPAYAYGRPANFVPYAYINNGGVQNFTNNTNTRVTLGTTIWDQDGMSLGSDRLTVQTPGLWDCLGHMAWNSTSNPAGGEFQLKLATPAGAAYDVSDVNVGQYEQARNRVHWKIRLGYGDVMELDAFQLSGGTVPNLLVVVWPALVLTWVGP